MLNQVHKGDCLTVSKQLADKSASIIIADPPYNIGKDFGNESDKQELDTYLAWCDKWIAECLRILMDDGTMFVYGFSEHLALILSRIPFSVQRRWLVWHYTNKNTANKQFWQRSHESILVLWKTKKVFNCDDVREPYTETFLKNAAGKVIAKIASTFTEPEYVGDGYEGQSADLDGPDGFSKRQLDGFSVFMFGKLADEDKLYSDWRLQFISESDRMVRDLLPGGGSTWDKREFETQGKQMWCVTGPMKIVREVPERFPEAP
jgi:hypothetical protein